jgi:hypothetical protein
VGKEYCQRTNKKSRKGNKPNEKRNATMLAEYNAQAAKGRVKHRKFAQDFYRNHGGQSLEATEKQLSRLLKIQREARKNPLLKRKVSGTFLGTK